MRPINSRNFGPNGIEIIFHNGTSVVTGYILKQVGTSRYVVRTGADATPYVVTLVDSNTPTAGFGAIRMTPHGESAVRIKVLRANHAVAFDGTQYAWRRGATTAAGQAKINGLAAPTDIALTTTSIPAAAQVGDTIATISGTDAGDVLTFTILADPDSKFSISANLLKAADTFTPGETHSVTIRATDTTGLVYDETFTLTVDAA